MSASESSLSTIVGVGIQNQHSSNGSYTALTAFDRLTLTDAYSTPQPSIEETDDEFDGSGVMFPTGSGVRLGVVSPVEMSGRLRPKNIITLLRAAGGANTPTNAQPVSGATTNVIIPVTSDALFPWATIYHAVGIGGNKLIRLIRDMRLSRFRIVANRNSIARFEATGLGAHEQIGAGTETLVADVDQPIRTVQGAFSFTKSGGGSLAGAARTIDMEILNEFPANDDNFNVGSHEMSWMTWLAQLCTGNCDVAFSKTLFAEMFYGGNTSAASGYSFTDLKGSLDFTMRSAGMVTGSTPYSVRVEIPHLIARGGEARSSGRNELRLPVAWRAFKSGSDPLWRITIVNAT